MGLMQLLNVTICLRLWYVDEPDLDFQEILLKQVLRAKMYT